METGVYDKIFEVYVNAICHFKKNGAIGFHMPADFHFHPVVDGFISMGIDLVIDGTADFFFDFAINLEYQRRLAKVSGDMPMTALYLSKTLIGLLRKADIENIVYLIQHHCELRNMDVLLKKLQ